MDKRSYNMNHPFFTDREGKSHAESLGLFLKATVVLENLQGSTQLDRILI